MIESLEPAPREAVGRSPLSGRVILAVDGRHRGDWDAVERAPGVARASSTGIFGTGLARLLGNHLNTEDAGLGRIVTYPEFAAALRALADDILDPHTPGWVVESVPQGRDIAVAHAVYPDAEVVGPDRSLADVLREDAPSPGGGHPPPDDLTDHLILVVGAPRSGTTWFERLLMAHPLAGGIDEAESWLFRGVSDLWNNHRGAGELGEIIDPELLARAIRAFSTRIFRHGMAGTPSARWFVEKTPGHVFLLPEIAAVWPDAWVINLVRDGRDVARSGAEMVHGPNDLRDAAAGWAAAIEAADRHGPALRRFREVRYEALLADAVEVTAGIFDWVGMPVDEEVQSAIEATVSKRVSQYNTSGPVGAGKWRSMRPSELRIVLAVAGNALVRKSYVDQREVAAARRALKRPWGRLAELLRRRRGRAPREAR